MGVAQSKPIDLQPRDTVAKSDPYGLRVGIDLSRPVLSFLKDDYTGLEIVGDYRLTKKLYLAAEIGNEKKSQIQELGNNLNLNLMPGEGIEELYSFTTSGSYIKLGVDYNTYQNWYGMFNSIYIGGRYAVSSFSQTLTNYSFFNSNRDFNPDGFVLGSNEAEEFTGLNASWLEFVVGLKAELFANIYLGASVRIGYLVSDKSSDRFPNLWIPGFNKVTDGSNFGVGYNYSITYFIPLYKKAKDRAPVDQKEE